MENQITYIIAGVVILFIGAKFGKFIFKITLAAGIIGLVLYFAGVITV